MAKHTIVRFVNGIAEIEISPSIEGMEGDETTFLDPDLSTCRRVPPELWQIVNGEIVPMTDSNQIAQRLSSLHMQLDKCTSCADSSVDVYQQQIDQLKSELSRINSLNQEMSKPVQMQQSTISTPEVNNMQTEDLNSLKRQFKTALLVISVILIVLLFKGL